tara:strand:- start:34 stop:831 length:798 start_codon:yes stop_codon:yes gene_type:complete
MSNREIVVKVDGLVKTFSSRSGKEKVNAVKNVSLEVQKGRTLGLVGESGSGKSTVARCITGLLKSDSGQVVVLGRDISQESAKQMRSFRQDLQIVFQEPLESLDPRYQIGKSIAEPLKLHTKLNKDEITSRVELLMKQVSLSKDLINRFPHQLSGGQQQRVNIARALATNPKVVILDEPTASLDVSVQLEILELLIKLQKEFDLTYILISHNLATVRAVCDTVAVMYLGEIIEEGDTDEIFNSPKNSYTKSLLGSYLPVDPREKV